MKKADTMLSFLFWAILGLLIFIPAAMWASEFLNLSNKAMESYSKLGEIVNSVKNGEELSMPVYMDKKSVIVGFAKNSNRFENHGYVYDRKEPDDIVFAFDRPKECSSLKACICICLDTDINQKTKPASAICNKGLKCASFDSIDLLSEKIVRTYGNDKPQNSWKGGFLHLRNVPAVANGLLQNQIDTRTFYIQRYKDVVDVCLSSSCITDEIKKQIDLNELVKSFSLFAEKYLDCRDNGRCGALNLKMPELYYIYYKGSASADMNGFYLMKGDSPKSFDEMEIVKNNDGSDVFYPGQLYKDENTEFSTGNVLEGYGQEFSAKGSKVILAKKAETP